MNCFFDYRVAPTTKNFTLEYQHTMSIAKKEPTVLYRQGSGSRLVGGPLLLDMLDMPEDLERRLSCVANLNYKKELRLFSCSEINEFSQPSGFFKDQVETKEQTGLEYRVKSCVDTTT